MTKTTSLALVVVAAHWITAIWHLFAVAKMLPDPNYQVSGLAILLMTLGHLGVSIAVWKLGDRLAGLVLLIFFLAAITADIYEHFVQRAPNNIFMTPAGDWTGWFYASVFILLGLEILGCLLGYLAFSGRARINNRRDESRSNGRKTRPLFSAVTAPLG